MEAMPSDAEVLGWAYGTAERTPLSVAVGLVGHTCVGTALARAAAAVGCAQAVLWAAAWADDGAAMAVALGAGAAAQSTGAAGSGWSVLHCACAHAGAGLGAGRAARLLVDAGADAAQKDAAGRAPVHIAAGAGAAGALDALLNRAHVFAECSDGAGRTAVHWAALAGSVACLQLLLDARCECDLRDLRGMTPLHCAARAGAAPACALLLRAGASPDTEDQWGQTPLVTARRHHFVRDTRNAALFAALEGRLDADQLDALVRAELSRTGAAPHAPARAADALFGTPAHSDHRDDDDDGDSNVTATSTSSSSAFLPNNSRAEKSV